MGLHGRRVEAVESVSHCSCVALFSVAQVLLFRELVGTKQISHMMGFVPLAFERNAYPRVGERDTL